ncbi:MAG: PorV/PorQ family protein [Candidatus Latescibacterota bacterium]|nr:MAG: PorV/PorQ family protein [Candidatus Latescibacterota bacterium]
MRHAATAILALVLLATPLATGQANAQSYGTELPFVLGTGARSSAMGVAAVSHGEDASIQHYNPSGLGYLQRKQFVFYRTTLFDSKSVYHSFSYAHPLLNYGTLAVSFMRVDIGGVEQRDETNRLLSSDLHSAQTRFLLGYAKSITTSLSAGFNLKIDNQSFGDYSGSGIGLDVGLSASQVFSGNSFIKGFREGFAVQNLIEPSLKLDHEKVADPFNLSLGVSAISGFGNVMLVTSLDIVNPRYSPFDLRFGQEVVYNRILALRFGMDDVTPTFGLGAHYKNVGLDYAYRSEDLGNNHRISLTVKFGSTLSEQRARARAEFEKEVDTRLTNRMADLERSQLERALENGDSLFARAEYEAAADQFEMALLWDPDNDHAAKQATLSRYQQAISMATKALENKDYVQGLFHANRALSYIPEDQAATNLARKCNERITEAKNSRTLLTQLLKTSIDLYADRQFADALAGFEEALRIAPDNQLAQEYRGKCKNSIETVVRRYMTDAEVRADNDDYVGAIDHLEHALAYNTRTAEIHALIEKYKKARAHALLASTKPETPGQTTDDASSPPTADQKVLENHYRRGMKSFDDGDFDGAIASFLRVWTVDQDYHNVSSFLTRAYLFVGMRLYSDHEYTKAIEIWQKVLTIDPENSKAKRYLSKAHEELEKLSGVYRGR